MSGLHAVLAQQIEPAISGCDATNVADVHRTIAGALQSTRIGLLVLDVDFGANDAGRARPSLDADALRANVVLLVHYVVTTEIAIAA